MVLPSCEGCVVGRKYIAEGVIFLSVTLAETFNLENLLFQARANWYIFQKARQHWLAAFGRGGDDHAV